MSAIGETRDCHVQHDDFPRTEIVMYSIGEIVMYSMTISLAQVLSLAIAD